MSLAGEGATRSFGHAGGAPGQNGDLRVFPDSGYVIVALSNLDPPAASRLADFIAARLPLAPTTTPRRAGDVVDDFESGTLAGWTIEQPRQRQLVHVSGRPAGADPKQSNAFVPFNMPNPPQGKFAAVSDGQGPGSKLMYRDIKLDGPVMLELTVFYVNGFDGLSGYSSLFVAPHTLAIDAGPNQQFRDRLLAPTAAADSMAVADVRATVFATAPDAPATTRPDTDSLRPVAVGGADGRLRIATADNQFPMRAGIDDVRLIPIDR